jgi:hypothetical protein
MIDMVNHPPHYTRGRFETIDVIDDIVQHYGPVESFYIANVIRYLSRAPHKGTLVEDLKKARWYLDRLVRGLETP